MNPIIFQLAALDGRDIRMLAVSGGEDDEVGIVADTAWNGIDALARTNGLLVLWSGPRSEARAKLSEYAKLVWPTAKDSEAASA